MKEERTKILSDLISYLRMIGSANDAEDRGFVKDANKMREESMEKIGELLEVHAWLDEMVPELREDWEKGRLFNFRWSNQVQAIRALLKED